MKTTISFALVALAATPALADEAITAQATPRNTVGVDAVAIMPIGDYADVSSLGAGASARLEVPIGTGFATGRLAAIFNATKVDANLTFIPIYAGYRLPLANDFYVSGELGITLEYGTVDTPLGQMSESDTALGFALMAGMRRGALDLRAGLFAPDAGDAFGLMASAGYDFAAF